MDPSEYDRIISVCQGEINRLNGKINAYNAEIDEYRKDFQILSDQVERLAELIIVCQAADNSAVNLSTSMFRFEEHIKYLDSVPHHEETFCFSDARNNNSSYNNTINYNLDYIDYLKKNISPQLESLEEEIADKIEQLKINIDTCQDGIGQYQRSIDKAKTDKAAQVMISGGNNGGY